MRVVFPASLIGPLAATVPKLLLKFYVKAAGNVSSVKTERQGEYSGNISVGTTDASLHNHSTHKKQKDGAEWSMSSSDRRRRAEIGGWTKYE